MALQYHCVDTGKEVFLIHTTSHHPERYNDNPSTIFVSLNLVHCFLFLPNIPPELILLLGKDNWSDIHSSQGYRLTE